MATAPATDAAKKWDGWNTSLKPALETITLAKKPLDFDCEFSILMSNLIKLEKETWLLLSVNVVKEVIPSNQVDLKEEQVTVQWNVKEATNLRGNSSERMDIPPLTSMVNTNSNIVSSWKIILDEVSKHGSKFITKTKSSQIIDWKTLNFLLSQITPEDIIKESSVTNGVNTNVSTAVQKLNVYMLLLKNILELFVIENVISLEHPEPQDGIGGPSLDPCIMARKPISEKTIVENVLKHGTGAINVGACRVGATESLIRPSIKRDDNQILGKGLGAGNQEEPLGRFPANLIHDGSREVLDCFPSNAGAAAPVKKGHDGKSNGIYGDYEQRGDDGATFYADKGSASRFFYCAKASKADREEGLKNNTTGSQGDKGNGLGRVCEFCNTPQLKAVDCKCETKSWINPSDRKNFHPTVKPTDLMRYLCRLITPPNGIVLDPFMGSGSTGKAAVLEGFNFIGIEMDEKYLDIATQRINHFNTTKIEPEEKTKKSKKEKPATQAKLPI